MVEWIIHIEWIIREKVNVGVNSSKVIVTKLKLDKDRKDLLNGKAIWNEIRVNAEVNVARHNLLLLGLVNAVEGDFINTFDYFD
ncbi:60S ribosomal protein L26-1-like protein [Tanacetum coccineum]